MLENALQKLNSRQDLTRQEMARATETMMRGECPEDEMAGFLTALHEKGEAVDEIVGAAETLRGHMRTVSTKHSTHVDTCGTGGDATKTFNVSTAAALVAAAAGVPVSKHGNRSITSKTGSADVLAALGVKVDAPPETISQCLDKLGIGFCFAPVMHPAMKQVGAARRRLSFPTIFNILGPLANPARAAFQIVGCGRAEVAQKLAQALSQLGTSCSLVVRGSDGMGEMTLTGTTHVWEAGPSGLREWDWAPEDFGIASCPSLEDLSVEGPEESAAIIRRVLAGEKGPARDIVVLNAAAALTLNAYPDDPRAAADQAQQAIDSQKASRLLEAWAVESHS